MQYLKIKKDPRLDQKTKDETKQIKEEKQKGREECWGQSLLKVFEKKGGIKIN